MKRHAVILLLAFFALSAASVAAAMEDRWLIGLDGLSSHIDDNEDENNISVDEEAGGVGFQVGYRFSPTFMLRLYASAADHETNDADVTIRFGGAQFEAVYLFRDGRAFRPYLFGGLGGFMLESQQSSLLYEAEGAGLSFGTGAHYFVSGSVSLHGSLRLEAVNWNKVRATYSGPGGDIAVETPVEESGYASKLSLGVAFWL